MNVFEILRLVWTIWYVYKDLIWMTDLCLCRFQLASYCCRFIFISELFFDSDCFFNYTRLCVVLPTIKVFPTCFRHLKQDLNSKLKFLSTCWRNSPSKWHQWSIVFSRPYVDIFFTNMVRISVLGELRMRQQNTKATVPLDVVPERRTERCSPRFRPGGRFLEPSFRYLSPGREGEKCRPLDHTWQNPFVHSARLTIASISYIYHSIVVISSMWYAQVCLAVVHI